MNVVTIIWSMAAAACLTLAAMNFLVWLNKRTSWDNLFISLVAAGTAGVAYFELAMMLAETPEAYGRAMRWVHLPLWVIVVSLVLFIRHYLRTGRLWLAWTVCGLRTLALILNFVFNPNIHYREITSLQHMRFLGETISVPIGVPNPWMLTAQLSAILLVAYAVDATFAVRRRGSSLTEVLMSSTITLFVAASIVQSILVFWGHISMPITISLFFLGVVSAIAYQMSLDVQRAANLADDLRSSEAALRASKNDLQQLAGRLISAQEEELRRLARDLHDDLSQRLAVAAIDVGKLEMDLKKMPENCDKIAHTAERIKEELIKVSSDVHSLSRQIHPAILDDLGLIRAIESECAAVMRRHPVQITFNKVNVPDEIPQDIALCLYRVIQEGLKNVTTHSEAQKCTIFLKGDDHALSLTLSDDGMGFDPIEAKRMPGLGLSSMRERVQLIQGEFSIQSRPGKGAVIMVSLPLAGGAA